ncbi:hypothetical protein HAX54_042261, partial [Datura stramonium]|nr:hypothetical protein [Datura stramonium]
MPRREAFTRSPTLVHAPGFLLCFLERLPVRAGACASCLCYSSVLLGPRDAIRARPRSF